MRRDVAGVVTFLVLLHAISKNRNKKLLSAAASDILPQARGYDIIIEAQNVEQKQYSCQLINY